MDAARQLLRYSIPGSVFILALVLMQAALNLAQGDRVRDVSASVSSGITLATAAASLPIGFLVYQIYFGRYRAFALWVAARTDRGAVVLGHLTCGQRLTLHHDTGQRFDCRTGTRTRRGLLLSVRPLRLDRRWLEGPCTTNDWCSCHLTRPRYGDQSPRQAYRTKWAINWQVVMSLLDLYGNDPRYAAVKREYTSLSDLYHSLGASRAALVLALAAWFGYNTGFTGMRIGWSLEPHNLVAAGVTAAVLVLLAFLSAARKQTQDALLSRLGISLRTLLTEHPRS